MKNYLIILVLLFSGCSFLYDSRNQNRFDIGDASYLDVNAKDSYIKTGRLITIDLLKCTKEKD